MPCDTSLAMRWKAVDRHCDTCDVVCGGWLALSHRAGGLSLAGGGGKFQKGRSGNPGGLTKHARAVRKSIAEQLEARCRAPGGGDKLVDALIAGIEDGDSTCIKLACEYRWGKPVERVEHSGTVGFADLVLGSMLGVTE